LTTISQGTATWLDKLYGLKADKVIVPPIKNLQAESVREVLNRFSLKYRDYYIMVGTLEPRKNIVSMLKAFNSTHSLVLVGGRGWRDSKILEEMGMSSKNVKILDYLPDTTVNALVK